MMSRRSVLVWCLVVGMWAASMGCVEGERSISGVEQQDHAIIGGEREPGYPAVGALIYEGEQFCTGTLVRPDVVITAAHCLIEDPDNPEAISFFIGPDPERLDMGRSIAVASLHIHPDYDDFEIINDFAVMRLAEEVTDVDTIPYLTDPMNETFIGRQALFIGYGLTSVEPEEVDGKQSVWITITEMDDTTFTYSEPGVNTCSGDSGGPALLEIDGTMTLIGVTSWGDEDCAEF
ncbi:MAG: trypsin-like serine protease, partial [Myxococcota bacterium]